VRKLWILTGLIFLSLPSPFLLADQIVLENGDRLTGTISKSDDKSLTLETEFAGEVTVRWAAISAISSTHPLHLGLKDGRIIAGPVKTLDGRLEV
jgi:hypothetical protein